MYVCGPTVYDEPHIGHARSAYVFDVIRRYLAYRGYKVKFVRNVTDVDDKIIEKAKKEYPGEDLNAAVKKVSEKYLQLYHQDMKLLGILEPDAEPKATEYLTSDKPLMQNFISGLIEKGAAYVSGGDVYFDIKKAKNYGKLSNQSLDKMESGARITTGENKRDPLDFALWKSAKPDEPSWDSSWGKGRPGWHIECSVMSSELLGDEFDIHGGGLDLIFPHHENELAQSESAGRKFARYWVHHGLLTINAQKMSKSLGNFVTIKDFLAKNNSADILKLFFLSAHYSHPIDYTEDKIEEARKGLERIEILLRRTQRIIRDYNKPGFNASTEDVDLIKKHKDNFFKAMDEDFNTPRALGSLFELANDANKFIDSKEDDAQYMTTVYQIQTSIEELGKNIFGIFTDLFEEPLTLEEENLFQARQNARRNKDYELADRLRKELEARGIILEDTKDGQTTWRRKI